MANPSTQPGGMGSPPPVDDPTQPAGLPQHAIESSAAVDATVPPPPASMTDPMSSSGAAPELTGAFGKYRIERILGRGGMGSVYLATDTQLQRPVALKVPNFSQLSNDLTERFLREARTAATLNHPNICPVYEIGQHAGHRFIAMGFIEGRTLADYIRPGKPQPERQIAGTVRKIAIALAEAHSHGIIHRDLKPANIMIDRRNEPILMDFGLARRNDDEQQPLTREGLAIGTPAYMAPEQIEGKPNVGPSADLFSLGVILYELITGVRPFQGSVISVIGQILHTDPRPIRELRPDVSDELVAICTRALRKNPAERYGSMRELAEALTAFMNGRRTSSPGATVLAVASAPAGVSSPTPASTRMSSADPDTEADDWGKLDIPARVPSRRARTASSSRAPAKRDNNMLLLMVGGPAAAALCIIAGVMLVRTFTGATKTPSDSGANAGTASATSDADGSRSTVASTAESKTLVEEPAPAPTTSEVPPQRPQGANDDPGPNTPEPRPPAGTEPPAKPMPEGSPQPGPIEPVKPEPPGEGNRPPFARPPEPPKGGPPGPPDIDAEFERFDTNKDGHLTRDELPPHVMAKADLNRDGKVTKKELKTAHEKFKERLHAPPGPNERRPPGGPPPNPPPR